jgi:hypothetical protein
MLETIPVMQVLRMPSCEVKGWLRVVRDISANCESEFGSPLKRAAPQSGNMGAGMRSLCLHRSSFTPKGGHEPKSALADPNTRNEMCYRKSKVRRSVLTCAAKKPLGAGLVRSPLARGIPAEVPAFFFIGL